MDGEERKSRELCKENQFDSANQLHYYCAHSPRRREQRDELTPALPTYCDKKRKSIGIVRGGLLAGFICFWFFLSELGRPGIERNMQKAYIANSRNTCKVVVMAPSDTHEEQLREVTVQTQVTWAVLPLTFFLGLVELLPEVRIYYNLLWSSAALRIVYLILAAGLSYSIIRFSIATLFVLQWRRLLPKDVGDKVVSLSPFYEKVLFNKNQTIRKWFVYLCSLLSPFFLVSHSCWKTARKCLRASTTAQ